MLNKMRCVLAVLLAAGLAMPAWAALPVANSLMPANGSTTYNTNPWITFNGTPGTGATQINNAEIMMCNNSGCSSPAPSLTCSASTGYDRWGCYTGDNPSCAGANSYPSQFKTLPTGNGTQITFRPASGCALNTGTWYVKVRVMDDQGVWSNWSSVNTVTVAATPTWNQTVTAGKSVIRVGDFTELRTYINNVRAARGYGTATYTNSTLAAGQVIHAVDITQMQSAFDTPFFYVTGSHIYSGSFVSGKCGLTTIPCDINSSFNTVTGGATTIRACHINDVRTLFTNCSP